MKKQSRSPERDEVGPLIRMAGPPAEVPQDVTRRVREAVRDRWQDELRKRSRRRRVWTGAALSAATLLAFTAGPALWRLARPPAAPGAVARVASIVHPVWIQEGRAAGRLRLADVLGPGASIVTEGKGAIAIRMETGHSVRLDRATRVRLLSGSTLELEEGAVYVDSGDGTGTGAGSLGIRTPFGMVRDIGTQYLVRSSDDGLSVRVREGEVLVSGGEAGRHSVTIGSELSLDPRGAASISDAPIYGPEWDWAERMAPMMDLEGRSLEVFLDWLARERGYRLHYADRDTQRAASRIVLSGSILGLSLNEALDAVLPTCGMTSRVVEGELRISPAGDGT